MATDDLASRVKRLEDIRALERLLNNYQRLADQMDWNAWIECFTEDAVLTTTPTGRLVGREQIFGTICETMRDYALTQHLLVNLEFEVEGDRATGCGNLSFVGVRDAAKPTETDSAGGAYSWEFVRTAGGWRIATCTVRYTWSKA